MQPLHDHRGVLLAAPSPNAGAARPVIREISLPELEDPVIRAAFLALHSTWIERGMKRWLSLVSPFGTRPVIVLGTFEGRDEMTGVIIAVWNDSPCERFDDLLERPGLGRTESRPNIGSWHLISVTTLEDRQSQGLGMGRLLLGQMLSMLGSMGHRHAYTLSPAFGITELMSRWSGSIEDAVLHAAREDARPLLTVMRLHLGGGARLQRVLHESRAEDVASLRLSLRFIYSTDGKVRAQQKERWLRWIACRAEHLSLVTPEFDNLPLYRADGTHDALVWDGPVIV